MPKVYPGVPNACEHSWGVAKYDGDNFVVNVVMFHDICLFLLVSC